MCRARSVLSCRDLPTRRGDRAPTVTWRHAPPWGSTWGLISSERPVTTSSRTCGVVEGRLCTSSGPQLEGAGCGLRKARDMLTGPSIPGHVHGFTQGRRPRILEGQLSKERFSPATRPASLRRQDTVAPFMTLSEGPSALLLCSAPACTALALGRPALPGRATIPRTPGRPGPVPGNRCWLFLLFRS